MNDRNDFLLKDYDLQIVNGDFVYDSTLLQESQLAIIHDKGNFRQFPTYGVGLIRYIGSPYNSLYINNIINSELKKDSLQATNITYSYLNQTLDLDYIIKLI